MKQGNLGSNPGMHENREKCGRNHENWAPKLWILDPPLNWVAHCSATGDSACAPASAFWVLFGDSQKMPRFPGTREHSPGHFMGVPKRHSESTRESTFGDSPWSKHSCKWWAGSQPKLRKVWVPTKSFPPNLVLPLPPERAQNEEKLYKSVDNPQNWHLFQRRTQFYGQNYFMDIWAFLINRHRFSLFWVSMFPLSREACWEKPCSSLVFSKIPRRTSKTPRIFLAVWALKNPDNKQKTLRKTKEVCSEKTPRKEKHQGKGECWDSRRKRLGITTWYVCYASLSNPLTGLLAKGLLWKVLRTFCGNLQEYGLLRQESVRKLSGKFSEISWKFAEIFL